VDFSPFSNFFFSNVLKRTFFLNCAIQVVRSLLGFLLYLSKDNWNPLAFGRISGPTFELTGCGCKTGVTGRDAFSSIMNLFMLLELLLKSLNQDRMLPVNLFEFCT